MISIYSPGYKENIGGIVVLYKLNDILSKNNIESQIIRDGICDYVIYPEIIKDNPFKAKHILRYNLYYTKDRHKDFTVFYSEEFYIKGYPKIFMPIIDVNFDVFKNLNKNRSGEVFLIGKRKKLEKNIKLCHPKTTVEINRKLTLREYSWIFNSVDKFICYDTNSFITISAALCGCKVMVVPYKGCTSDMFFKIQPYGVDYGESRGGNINLLKPWLEEKLNKQDENVLNIINNWLKNCNL